MTDAKKVIEGGLKEIEASLVGRLLRWHADQANWAIDVTELTAVAHTHGKRLRPRFLLIVNGMCGGTMSPAVRDVSEVLELYHGLSLIYDDVQDNARTRRGEPAHHTTYSVSATLSLCALLSRHVTLILLESDSLSLSDRLWILQHFTRAQLATGLGQMAETAWIRDEVLDLPVDKYWRTIQGKTASLFQFAAEAGAYLGSGGDEVHVAAYRDVGSTIGILFQLVDDYADVFLPDTDGKPRCQDIREAKRTLFWLHTRQALSQEDRTEFDCLFLLAERSEEQVERIHQQMLNSGAQEIGQTEIRRLSGEVASGLDGLIQRFAADPAYTAELQQLIRDVCRELG
jgi:octaprenyl-diphosphate synthase